MNFLIAIDQLFNALAGGNPDVTISSHVYTMDWNRLEKIINFTFMDKKHCRSAYENDNDYDTTDNCIRTAVFAIIGCILLFLPIRIIKLCQQ